MQNTAGKSILLLDPATPWGNKYGRLIDALEAAGFDVNIFQIVPLKDKFAYDQDVDQCILLLEMCDILLKPQDDIVDYWMVEMFSKRKTGLKKIIEYAESNHKPVVTFRADWADYDDNFDYIYFADNPERIVAEIKSKIGGRSRRTGSSSGK
jgi:hypothetical protein